VLAEITPQLPQEILDNIRGQSVSTIIGGNIKIICSSNQGPAIERLEVQVEELYEAVKKENMHFWPALLRPVSQRAGSYANGTKEQMQIVLQYLSSKQVL